MSRFYLNKLRLALMTAVLANRTAAAELTLISKSDGVRKSTLQHDSLTVLLNIRIRNRDGEEEPLCTGAWGSRKAPRSQQAQPVILST